MSTPLPTQPETPKIAVRGCDKHQKEFDDWYNSYVYGSKIVCEKVKNFSE